MTRDVTDSEAKAPIIVPLSRKVGIRATTPIAQSWRSVAAAAPAAAAAAPAAPPPAAVDLPGPADAPVLPEKPAPGRNSGKGRKGGGQ